MNTLVVYFSKYGNTQKVAETIAAEFEKNGITEVLCIDDLDPTELNGVNLVIMGTPTHRMNIPETAKAKLKGFPKHLFKGKRVAAFDTSYRMNWFLNQFTASKKLAQKLRQLGGKRVVPPETFHVMDTEGPLYEGELKRAKIWARQIMQKTGVQQKTVISQITGGLI